MIGFENRSIKYIERAAQMTNLIEAFLLLAREPDRHIESGVVCLNDLLMEEIDRGRTILEGRSVSIETKFSDRMMVRAPERVLSVLLGNLLRNAVPIQTKEQ
jgi:signal transduction histidine kinase